MKSLQAIKFLLEEQQNKDTREINLGRTYLNEVETNPMFKSLYNGYMSIIESLKDVEWLQDIVDEMEIGELSSIANALSTGAYAVDELGDMLACADNEELNKDDNTEFVATNVGADVPKAQEAKNQVEEKMDDLRYKDAIIQATMDNLRELEDTAMASTLEQGV